VLVDAAATEVDVDSPVGVEMELGADSDVDPGVVVDVGSTTMAGAVELEAGATVTTLAAVVGVLEVLSGAGVDGV
jgi:hypothetical protein